MNKDKGRGRKNRLVLGSLLVEVVNKFWGLALSEGHVVCSKRVLAKIASKHAEDVETFEKLGLVSLVNPTYVGLNPRHPDSVELIKSVESEKGMLLLAVSLRLGKRGDYMLTSAYRVRKAQVEKRLKANTLKVVI